MRRLCVSDTLSRHGQFPMPDGDVLVGSGGAFGCGAACKTAPSCSRAGPDQPGQVYVDTLRVVPEVVSWTISVWRASAS